MGMPELVVAAVLDQGRSKSEVARTYGVSRRWVITLVQRFEAEGPAGLDPRSRRPRRSPTQTPEAIADEIVEIRKALDHDAGLPYSIADPRRSGLTAAPSVRICGQFEFERNARSLGLRQPIELEVELTPSELRRSCLSKPCASEDFPFGEQVSVFKVADKVFAIADLDGVPLEVSVKCDPDVTKALRSTRPAIRPGYHLNKRHWNTVTLDGSISDGEIEDMIQDSYDLVAAKLTRAQREEIGLTNASTKPTSSR